MPKYIAPDPAVVKMEYECAMAELAEVVAKLPTMSKFPLPSQFPTTLNLDVYKAVYKAAYAFYVPPKGYDVVLHSKALNIASAWSAPPPPKKVGHWYWECPACEKATPWTDASTYGVNGFTKKTKAEVVYKGSTHFLCAEGSAKQLADAHNAATHSGKQVANFGVINLEVESDL